MSGLFATQYAGGYKNWHKENIEETLKALAKLGDVKDSSLDQSEEKRD